MLDNEKEKINDVYKKIGDEEEKEKVSRELKNAEERLKVWEKNNINKNDVLYLNLKNKIIPNLRENYEQLVNDQKQREMSDSYDRADELEEFLDKIKDHTIEWKIKELNGKLDEVFPEVEEIEAEAEDVEEVEVEEEEPKEERPEESNSILEPDFPEVEEYLAKKKAEEEKPKEGRPEEGRPEESNSIGKTDFSEVKVIEAEAEDVEEEKPEKNLNDFEYMKISAYEGTCIYGYDAPNDKKENQNFGVKCLEIEEVLNEKDVLFEKEHIEDKLKEIVKGKWFISNIERAYLKNRINPLILKALGDNDEAINKYISALYLKKNFDFEYEVNLEKSKLTDKSNKLLNKIAKRERKIPNAKVILPEKRKFFGKKEKISELDTAEGNKNTKRKLANEISFPVDKFNKAFSHLTQEQIDYMRNKATMFDAKAKEICNELGLSSDEIGKFMDFVRNKDEKTDSSNNMARKYENGLEK
jgi:hypothetical protein